MSDLRRAFRQWLKAPGFTLVAVLTLGLGIGSCTVVFSWIRSVLVQTVPGARDPGRLVVLVPQQPDGEVDDTLSRMDERDLAETGVFEGVVGSQMEVASLRVDGDVEWVWAQPATANYFDVLGVTPVFGRGFRPGEDESPGGDSIVVISHRLWQRRFGGDPAVIGRSVEISKRPFTIIGVTPEGFRGTMGGLGFDLWLPVSMSTEISDMTRALNARGIRWLHTLARLREGISIPQAQAAVGTTMRRLATTYPDSNRHVGVAVLPVWKAPYGAQSRLLPLLTALASVAALLLLLVIANVANLLLARATAREGEMAIRLSMGAPAGRLIRQTLIESLALASLGGVLGCLLAAVFSRALLWLLPVTYLPIALEFPVDAQVLAFTMLVTLATGLLFGLAPAWRASHANVAEVLKAGGRTGETSRAGQRVRQGLVIAEIAVAFVLLIGMTLCARSFDRARTVSVGLEPRNTWIAGFRLPPGATSEVEAAGFYRRLKASLENLPGVESVALCDWLPLGFEGGSSTRFSVPGHAPAVGEIIEAGVCLVSEDYFRTLRIPILHGREFDARDGPDSPRAVVINDQLARRFFPDRDPVGCPLNIWGKTVTIVGVSRTGKYRSLNEPPTPYLYLPVSQNGDYGLNAVLRTRPGSGSMARAIERTARELDPNVKPMASMSMTQFMEAAYMVPRTAAVLLGVLGGIAVLLASLGIYAVIAWSVGRRVREVGVRMALGAQRSEVAWLFIRQGVKLTVIAVAFGLLGALFAGRILGSMLIGISTADPLTYLVALSALGIIVLFACWLPARKASQSDPMTALRSE